MKVSTQSLTLCTVLIAATLLNDVDASDRGMGLYKTGHGFDARHMDNFVKSDNH